MALIPCSECGKEMSPQAAACPHCGHPLDGRPDTAPATKKVSRAGQVREKEPFFSKGSGCALFVVALFIFFGVVGYINTPPKTEEELEAERRYKAQEEEQRHWKVQNSAWDGSVVQVEQWLKKSLRDPDSFEAVTWGRVKKTESGYQVTLTYRAKNGFGGVNVTNAVFLLSEDGVVIGNL